MIAISSFTGSAFIEKLMLNPYAILHGEIWRIVSWVLMPPSSLSIFTIIMLFCYYQLGTMLERVWGDFLYNVYIFFGLIMTIVGVFIIYFVFSANATESEGALIGMSIGMMVSTYYVSLSIFLGFAMTFPEQRMLLFFFIPIKIKWLAFFDVAYLAYYMIIGSWYTRVQIICSLASTIIFFIVTRKNLFRDSYVNAQSRGRRNEFKRAQSQGQAKNSGGARHKCYICGQTELSNPDLEFRYCSKCNGNYEYCQNHLFTHKHIT